MVGVATDSTVGLAWTASLGALEYNVYSCSDELCSNGALLGTTSNTSTFITGVIPDSTYTYFVSPKNSFGFGTLSVVSVSTLSDATAPFITLTGSATVTHVLGATYTDAGATATDAVDGDLSVTASGTVDVNVIGTYTITYSVSDAASNAATQVTRTVNVVDIATIDSDDDGIVDISDTYPLIAIGSLTDTDSDGASDSCDEPCLALGMAADTDDDNDGVLDTVDAYPLIAIGDLVDTDADGAPDECDEACVALGMAADTDDDNDGVLDTADAHGQ